MKRSDGLLYIIDASRKNVFQVGEPHQKKRRKQGGYLKHLTRQRSISEREREKEENGS